MGNGVIMMKEQRDLEGYSRELVCSMKPEEFEKYCKEILTAYAEKERLPDFVIKHNEKMSAYDSEYQIDLHATFSALGVRFEIICECKRYSSPVERKVVQELDGKVKSLGAHKGIVLSTSPFQSGAVQYAKAHGIALIQVFDKECEHHSFGKSDFSDNSNPFIYGYNKLPPYKAIEITEDSERCKNVYPPASLIFEILDEQWKMIYKNREDKRQKF